MLGSSKGVNGYYILKKSRNFLLIFKCLLNRMEDVKMTFRNLTKNCLAEFLPPCIKRHYQGVASVVMYHRLTKERLKSSSFSPNFFLSVHVEEFEKQLAYYAENFECLSIDDFYQAFIADSLPSRTLVITFDDGYLDNLTLALPLFEKYKIPASIFVSSAQFEGKNFAWWYSLETLIKTRDKIAINIAGENLHFEAGSLVEKNNVYEKLNMLIKRISPSDRIHLINQLNELVTYDEHSEVQKLTLLDLKALAASPYVTIGAHTVHHHNLSLCQVDVAKQEMLQSKQFLEQQIGKAVDFISYPYGESCHASEREYRLASELGFKAAFTTKISHIRKNDKNHLFDLPRIGIGYRDSLKIVDWKLSGVYAMFRGRR